MRTTVGTLLMTLLVACGGSDPAATSTPPSSSAPGDPGASANGKTPVTDSTSSTTPTPKQDPPATTPTTPAAKPTFAWAPDYADFAATLVGESTASQTVTLTNTSDVDVTAGLGLHLNGSQFVLGANECTGALSAHGSCKVEIIFRPTLATAAEGLIYVLIGNATQGDMAVHLTGTGKEPPVDPGMSTPPLYPPGTYPMCASPVPAGSDWVCGTAGRPLKKDGYICGTCIVGSTQECLPDHAGTLCVASCGECQ